jgi:hypothetical protein
MNIRIGLLKNNQVKTNVLTLKRAKRKLSAISLRLHGSQQRKTCFPSLFSTEIAAEGSIGKV